MSDRTDAAADEAVPVFRLVHRSHSLIAPDRRRPALGEISTTARRKNRGLGVTGAPVVSGDAFAQVLEGEEASCATSTRRSSRTPATTSRPSSGTKSCPAAPPAGGPGGGRARLARANSRASGRGPRPQAEPSGARMGIVTVGQENSTPVELSYEDHGSGPPVVLLHGRPLDSRSWEPQLHGLLMCGHRVVTYDRRGFGRSSRPTEGYDFDTLASDLEKVLTELDLHDVTLVGFSLGTGEMARYTGTHGTDRVRACVFIESLAPTFQKSDANPKGVDQAAVDGVQQAILQDRCAWLSGLLADFLNLDELLGTRVSEDTARDSWNAGAMASPYATWACVPGRLDDFTRDVERIDVPTLIQHGTADRILAIDGLGRRLHGLLPEAHLVEIEGGPHVVAVTHAKEVNRELMAVLRQLAPVGAPA